MSGPAATKTILLRPVSGTQADGSQLFEVVEPAVPAWVSTTTYQSGNQATGSDGKVYISKINQNRNINPVGDAAVHWLPLW